MKPATPFHINHPRKYGNGVYAPDPSYEVVGHRDGPVVARFPFLPNEEEYHAQAFALASKLVAESESPPRLRCPYCGGVNLTKNMIAWAATSTEPHDADNRASLDEHQCRDCHRPFWTGQE